MDADTSSSHSRIPFEVREDDRDYSGMTITNRSLIDIDIEKSFFNGVDLFLSTFQRVRLNNSEFSEAAVKGSFFDTVDFSGCDFVDCLFETVTFRNCQFDKGEWREARFVNCRFVDCRFDHTTITLCTFDQCILNEPSIQSIQHRAIYFNVFTQCSFAIQLDDHVFGARNFGVPLAGNTSELIAAGADISVEQLCLLNNVGAFRAVILADTVQALAKRLEEGDQRRNSTLTFVSHIIRVTANEKRIGAVTLIYLEDILASLGARVHDQDLFMATMNAVIEIRSALFSTETDEHPSESAEGFAKSMQIYFSETFGAKHAQALIHALADASQQHTDAFRVEKIETGSTLIEIVCSIVIPTSILLAAVNHILRQATVTVERIDAFRKAARKLTTPLPSRRTKRAKPTAETKVQAVLSTGLESSKLTPVRTAVRREGRVLVELDEPASVTIRVQ